MAQGERIDGVRSQQVWRVKSKGKHNWRDVLALVLSPAVGLSLS